MGMAANSPAARRARARRPFSVLTAAPPPPSPAATNRENVEDEAVSFSQCLRRFGNLASKPAKKCSSASASASRTPRTGGGRRRIAKKCSIPVAMAAAPYDAPRAPLSSPFDDVEESGEGRRGGEGSRSRKKRTTARRSVALREAMATLPEHGDGRVRYMVDTFERLLSLASDPGAQPQSRGAAMRRRRKKMTSWPPPSPATATARPDEIDVSYPSIASSSEVSFFPIINGVRLRRSDARDSPRRQKRCNSICSSERIWSRKKIGVTIQRPFNLRTEKRGMMKEENLVQRMKNKLLEEERLRNPFAQGLPWTTDVPENAVKPLAKEPTEPIDVVLHSEVRAVCRARFDHQVAERNSFLEKLNMEKEREQKLDEEIEIKQLRKEMVTKAHPMPDFSKPFVPKRSVKPQTVPREPRFHRRLTRHNSKT